MTGANRLFVQYKWTGPAGNAKTSGIVRLVDVRSGIGISPILTYDLHRSMNTLGLLRWMTAAVVFGGAALIFGQIVSETRGAPASVRLASRLTGAEAPKYSRVATTDQEVKTAVQVALSDQRRKNRSAVKLLSVLAAERQASSGANIRLCLSIDRHGRADSARVVVHHSDKDSWSVTLWAWGACRSEDHMN
jgi:hypothetical protein